MVIETFQLSRSFGRVRAVQRLDLKVKEGEAYACLGSHGAGKTTLLHLLVGLQVPDRGDVLAFGRARRAESDFFEVRARVGLLFQDSDDQLFSPTVLEDLAFGPLNLGRSPDQARADAERILDLLAWTDLNDFKHTSIPR